ncbi:MAG: tRNA-uridine aminocarboxypropyltransferase [Bdellovibrionota bacterium]
MDIQEYRQRRETLLSEKPKYRCLCMTCMQPDFGCYCPHVQKFDPKIKFVILIHPIEVKRRIATGRMSHLCMPSSKLVMGQDYTLNKEINEILEDSNNQPVVLYPGRKSLNLTGMSAEQRTEVFDSGKTPVVFVIDGTWATARKMIRQSKNLFDLPRICFTPPGPSRFRVRKQPGVECYSTIEAIHHTIELLGDSAGFSTMDREHDKLLYVFDKMVERQLDFIRESLKNPRAMAYRRQRLQSA